MPFRGSFVRCGRAGYFFLSNRIFFSFKNLMRRNPNGKLYLALDQGTTSSRAILFDQQQNIIGISQKEFTQHYPREGWVEHDPMEIYSSQYAVMMEVITQSGVEVSDIKGIGITNQRETTILWTKRPAARSTTRLSGSAPDGGPGGRAKKEGPGGIYPRGHGPGAGRLLFPRPRLPGFSTTSRREGSGPGGEKSCLGRWTAG